MPTCRRPRLELLLHALVGGLFEERLIPPGAVLDVGANDGEMAAYYACLDASRTVHALEPSARLYETLERRARDTNIKPLRAGVSRGDFTLTPNAGNEQSVGGGGGELIVNARAGDAPFPVYRVDTLFGAGGAFAGERLGFWHLDVEWHELEALRGAVATVKRDRPVFTAELHVHQDRKYTRDLVSFVEALDYEIYVVDEICGVRIDCRNLLCVPQEFVASAALKNAVATGAARRADKDDVFASTPASVPDLVKARSCDGRGFEDVHLRKHAKALPDPMEATAAQLADATAGCGDAGLREAWARPPRPAWLDAEIRDRPPSTTVPRVVWTYWDTWPDAPAVVKHCVASWVLMNPTWKVRLVTDETVLTYLPSGWTREKWNNVTVGAHKGDVLRIVLLARRGGVWADATLFCLLPLDAWIFAAVGSNDFFAFSAGDTPKKGSAAYVGNCPGCESAGAPAASRETCRARGGKAYDPETRRTYARPRRRRTTRISASRRRRDPSEYPRGAPRRCRDPPPRNIHDAMPRPVSKRMYNPSNSFLAAAPGSYVAAREAACFADYMLEHLRAPEYTYFHACFRGLARDDATFRDKWLELPELASRRVVGAVPVSGHYAGHRPSPVTALTPLVQKRVDDICGPHVKLTYKAGAFDEATRPENATTLGYLFSRTWPYLGVALRGCGAWPCVVLEDHVS